MRFCACRWRARRGRARGPGADSGAVRGILGRIAAQIERRGTRRTREALVLAGTARDHFVRGVGGGGSRTQIRATRGLRWIGRARWISNQAALANSDWEVQLAGG